MSVHQADTQIVCLDVQDAGAADSYGGSAPAPDASDAAHGVTQGVCPPADPVLDSIPGEMQQCLKVQLYSLINIRNTSHYMPVDISTPGDLNCGLSCCVAA